MLVNNLAITTPSCGTIRIGDIVTNERGKRHPVRLNHFRITTQVKDSEGDWVLHPLQEELLAKAKETNPDLQELTEIPIRLMYNNPALNMRARYEAFDQNGRIVCAGNGKCARRIDNGQIKSVGCPGAEYCEYGKKVRCDLFGRLNVQIDGQDDEFSTFILRTESVNTVRTLEAKMQLMYAMFGNRLTGIPMKLRLRKKASKASMWSRFYYVDLVLNGVSAIDAMKLAKQHEDLLAELGMNQQAMEQAAVTGLESGAFEEDSESFDELEAFIMARGLSDGESGSSEQVGEDAAETAPAPMTGLDALHDLMTAAESSGVLRIGTGQETEAGAAVKG